MRRWAAIGVLLAAAFALTFALAPWDGEHVSDMPVYRAYADLFIDGQAPYRDVRFEYPPLAAPLLALPGLVSLDYDGYRLAFAALALLLAAALVVATGRAAVLGEGSQWRAMAAVAAAPIATGAMIRTHFDLAPVLCLVAGLVAVGGGRTRLGFALFGVGGALKLFPLAAVPVAAAWLIGRGRGRDAWEGAAVAAAVTAAAVLGAVLLSPDGAWNALDYQANRPVQIESLPATALNAVDALGGRAPSRIHSHNSDGLEHPAADALGVLSLGIFCAALAALVLVAYRVRDQRGLVLAGLGTAAAFAAFGKVLSPQFMVWLVPLGALAWAWRMRALALAAAAAVALTLVWFPARYFDVVDRETFPLLVVSARNLALIAALALLARELWLMVTASAGAARSTPLARPDPLR